MTTLCRGDVFRHVYASPGGWGDPGMRDPERVRHDVREEKLSVAQARRAYGVVLAPITLTALREEPARFRTAR